MYRQSEKNLLNSNIFSRRLHNMANFGPLTAEIGSGVWSTPANFNGFHVLGFITAATSLTGVQPNFTRCLAISWAGTPYIHFQGLLPPDGILPCAKFTLCPKSCILLYWQRYCMALQLQGQPKFAELSRGSHLYSEGRPSRWELAHILVYHRLASTSHS